MKKRKGFGLINIDGKTLQFNWAKTPNGPILFIYDGNKRLDFKPPYDLSEATTWHGKHKDGPEWGGYGKKQVREIYLKHKNKL